MALADGGGGSDRDHRKAANTDKIGDEMVVPVEQAVRIRTNEQA